METNNGSLTCTTEIDLIDIRRQSIEDQRVLFIAKKHLAWRNEQSSSRLIGHDSCLQGSVWNTHDYVFAIPGSLRFIVERIGKPPTKIFSLRARVIFLAH